MMKRHVVTGLAVALLSVVGTPCQAESPAAVARVGILRSFADDREAPFMQRNLAALR